MPRQFLEVEPMVERLGGVVDAVDDHGDEGKRLAGLETIVEGLGEEEAAEALPLALDTDAEPGEDRHGQLPAWEPADGHGGKVGEVDLASGQREITRDCLFAIEKDLGYRQMLILVLKGLGREPVVDLFLARPELPARVVAA